MSTDIVSFGETMLRLTAPNNTRLESTPQLQVYVGGTESNTLACLARLNLKATWISALPANPLGRHIDTELRSHGVDTSHVVWAEPGSRLGIFYVEEAALPLGLQVYYDRAHSACSLIEPDTLDLSFIDEARLLHLTGITPALSDRTREVFRRMLARAHASHIPLSFDVNYRAKLWSATQAAAGIEEACQQASILICARADATELWGLTGTPQDILGQMAQRFTTSKDPRRFVLTLGSEGSAQFYDGLYTEEPAIPTTGAIRFGSGDAFAAGYLYAYLNGPLYQELHEERNISALRFGNALAALKRCIVGDIAVITPEDVRTVLRRESGGRFR